MKTIISNTNLVFYPKFSAFRTSDVAFIRGAQAAQINANSQQPTANSQQPTANSQQPTANSQQPTDNR